MTVDFLYTVYLTVLTILGALACVLFIVRYWWITRGGWAHEEAGQFFMVFTFSVGGLLTILLLNQWLGDWMLRRPLTTLISTTFVASLWWPLRLLWLAQRERKQQ